VSLRSTREDGESAQGRVSFGRHLCRAIEFRADCDTQRGETLGYTTAENELVHRLDSDINRPVDVWFRDGSDERLHKVFRTVCVGDV
jgi:hypothetical protein